MKDDEKMPPLPTTSRRRVAQPAIDAQFVDAKPASQQSLERVETIKGSLQVAQALVSGYFEIRRIREQGTVEAGRLRAETQRIEVTMAGEVAKLAEQRKGLESRGAVVVQVIRAVTEQLHVLSSADAETRRAVIDGLPRLVQMALGSE